MHQVGSWKGELKREDETVLLAGREHLWELLTPGPWVGFSGGDVINLPTKLNGVFAEVTRHHPIDSLNTLPALSAASKQHADAKHPKGDCPNTMSNEAFGNARHGTEFAPFRQTILLINLQPPIYPA